MALNTAQTRFYLAVMSETSRILSSGTGDERRELFLATEAGIKALREYSDATPDDQYSCDRGLDVYREAFSAAIWGK